MEIVNEFFWGPRVLGGAFDEGQELQWHYQGGKPASAYTQKWQRPALLTETEPHGPLQSLVFRRAKGDEDVVALRWDVERDRPGTAVHGFFIEPAGALSGVEAIAYADTLRWEPDEIERVLQVRKGPITIEAVSSDPPGWQPGELDLLTVQWLRARLVSPNYATGRFAVLGNNEPQIRAHMQAAMATLPAGILAGAYFSTMECLITQDTPPLVGVIEPLWMGSDLGTEFAELSRIEVGRSAAGSGALALALRYRFARQYLRGAVNVQDLQDRERTLLSLKEPHVSSKFLALAIQAEEWTAISDLWAADETTCLALLDKEDYDACAALLGRIERLHEPMARHLARTRSDHPDRFVGSLLADFDPTARRSFFKHILTEPDARSAVHPNCQQRPCVVQEQFDDALLQDSALLRMVRQERPDLLPITHLGPDQQLDYVFNGEARSRQIRPDDFTADQVFTALRRRLDSIEDDRPIAQHLVAWLRDGQTEELLTLLVRHNDTLAFAVGPFLAARAPAVPDDRRASYVTCRTFQPGSRAYDAWCLPQEAVEYLGQDFLPTGATGEADGAALDRALADRAHADQLLSKSLPALPVPQAQEVFRRHFATIATTYQIPVEAAVVSALSPPAVQAAPPEYLNGATRPTDLGRVAVMTGGQGVPPIPPQPPSSGREHTPPVTALDQMRTVPVLWLVVAGGAAVMLFLAGLWIGRATVPQAPTPTTPSWAPITPTPSLPSAPSKQRRTSSPTPSALTATASTSVDDTPAQPTPLQPLQGSHE